MNTKVPVYCCKCFRVNGAKEGETETMTEREAKTMTRRQT